MASSGGRVTRLSHLECARRGHRHAAAEFHQRCRCGGTLLARYDLENLAFSEVGARPPGTWRYRELLPVEGDPVTLGEPETPLLFASRLSERWGVEVYVKDDSLLPGGTFKARGACVGLSRALEVGVKKVVMPSAGNAGGAWSLYAACAGVDITVTMSETAPKANQAEVLAVGGELVLVEGSIADAGRRAAEIAEETGAFLATTFSEPYRLEGKKSAWLEVFEQLAQATGANTPMVIPRTIVLPVGGGVALIAAAKGAEEVTAAGWAPKNSLSLVGVQAANCAPITRAFEKGSKKVPPWKADPYTIAAGLRVPAPVEGALVLEFVRASDGTMLAVTEEVIVEAVRDLASTEGIFACPEGASTVAAAGYLAERGELEGPVVLYNTGGGAKYADALAEAGLSLS
jgi:threonine synthase